MKTVTAWGWSPISGSSITTQPMSGCLRTVRGGKRWYSPSRSGVNSRWPAVHVMNGRCAPSCVSFRRFVWWASSSSPTVPPWNTASSIRSRYCFFSTRSSGKSFSPVPIGLKRSKRFWLKRRATTGVSALSF
jgi:hypothetical protein